MQIYQEHYFSYLNYQVRVVYIEKKPWFIIEDLSYLLDYSVSHVLETLEEDETKEIFTVCLPDTPIEIVDIQGVYKLLLGDSITYNEYSELRHWFNDNLPPICFHGIVNKPEKDIFKAKHIEEKRFDSLDARVNSINSKLLSALKEIDQMKIEIAQLLTKMEERLGIKKSY